MFIPFLLFPIITLFTYTAALPSYPSVGPCSGSYYISDTTDGIITSHASIWHNYTINSRCLWLITAPPSMFIKITFNYFHTECSWDYLHIYDGNSSNSSSLASLTGNRNSDYGYSDIIHSNSNQILLIFTSDASISAKGFEAIFTLTSDATDIVEKTFTKRKFHSAAIDTINDIIYITFGLGSLNYALDDMILYFPANQSYFKKNLNSPHPEARYQHSSWWFNSSLYIYGGRDSLGNSFYNQIWKYTPINENWSKLASKGASLAFISSSPSTCMVPSNNSFDIYVFGGKDYATPFRSLYRYRQSTGIWVKLADANFPIWGGSLIYDNYTQTLILMGGLLETLNPVAVKYYPSLKYSIESDQWYTANTQLPSFQRTYSPSLYYGDSFGLLFGGQEINTYLSDIDHSCFHSNLGVYDIACNSWNYISYNQSWHRMGHAAVIRNNTVMIFGGNNGILLDDLITIDIDPKKYTLDSRNSCKALNSCKGFTGCLSCLNRSKCGWCSDSCSVNNSTLISLGLNSPVCPANKLIETSPMVCSSAILLTLGSTKKIYLNNSSPVDLLFTVYQPDYDISIFISNINGTDSTLNITLPYLNCKLEQTGNFAYIYSTDVYRIVGNYIIRVSLDSVSASSLNKLVSFDIYTTLTLPSWYFPASSNTLSDLDFTAFAVIFTIATVISFIITVIMHRARRRIIERGYTSNQEAYQEMLMTDLPEIFTALLDIPANKDTKRRGSNVNRKEKDGNATNAVTNGLEKDPSEKWISVIPRMLKNISKSISNFDIFENSSKKYPLAVQKITDSNIAFNSTAIPITAVSYLVLYPRYEQAIEQGFLPELAIGTVLYREDNELMQSNSRANSETKTTAFSRFSKRFKYSTSTTTQ